jgi:Tol biopolymer transport system component
MLCALLLTAVAASANLPGDDVLIVVVESPCQDNPACRPTGSLYTVDVATGAAEFHRPHETFHGGIFSPDAGKVAFTTWVVQTTEDQDLYVYDLQSRTARLLIPKILQYESPIWSPDGTQLAFVGGEEHQLHLVDGSTADLSVVQDSRQVSGVPQWSPDGAQLAFTATAGEREQVFTVNIRDGVPIQRTSQPEGAVFHAWSPGGTQIAYRTNGTGARQVFLFDVAQNAYRQLTFNDDRVDFQAWSPDGQWILYLANPYAPEGEQSSTCVRRVADGQEWCVPGHHPFQWSPDGRYLATIEILGQGNFAVELAEANGDELRRLELPQGVYQDLSWSPDGTAIAFAGNIAGEDLIYVAEAASGQVRVVARGDQQQPYYKPLWSPDSRWLVVRQFSGGRDPVYLLDIDGGDARLLLQPDGIPFMLLWWDNG